MGKKMALARVKKRFVLGAMLSSYALLAAVHLEPARAEDPDQSAWPTKEWLTSTPEEQGMDSSALAEFVAYGAGHDFDSLLVARHGRIVLDAYYAPYTADLPHAMYSSTKAVTGTLIGMAYKDGVLDRLDHPVLDFFSDRNIAHVDDRKKAITVQNLLDMTSGLDWIQGHEGGVEQSVMDEERSPDWIQFILDRPMAYTPGWFYYYSNGNPHLLSAIITKLTGKRAEDYAKEKLFAPLGITTWRWRRDPQGLSTGEGGLALSPRDMAKIGLLYLHHGEWDGGKLLPPGWADVLSQTTVNMNDSSDSGLRYSNLFWVFPKRRIFMATGRHCQLIIVAPDLDIVAVVTARKVSSFGRIADYVSGAVKSVPALPPNPAAVRLLASAVSDISTERPSEVGPAPETASVISGKTYKFPRDNALNIKSLTLFLTDSHPHMANEYYLRDAANSSIEVEAPIGLDGLYRKGSPTIFGIIPTTKGSWLNEQTFVIDWQWLGCGEEGKTLLSFAGKRLNLRGKDWSGRDVSVDGEQVD
jgi:CubicO group peptidase (beta-lactamase class C family)